MKSVKFFTLGCKVNQYETQAIREQFLRHGFQEQDNGKSADLYLVNTCTVTGKADTDSLYYIHWAKKENPRAKIIVTGCLTELDSNRIKRAGADLIVKNKDKQNILGYLLKNLRTEELKDLNAISYFKNHTRAFLKIQDGCDNFCSYCKVPLVRGRSRSRPLPEVIRQAQALVENGYKEIVLCGICLGSYGRDLNPKTDLTTVIGELEKLDRLARIRLSSIEAGDVTGSLISKMAGSKKLCRHLHIPIQSGDDRILKRMNRRYTRGEYLKLIKKIRGKVPAIAITTDVLVGFPQETEENFQNTVELIKEILPLKVHIFPYSERAGTSAALSQGGKIGASVVKKRILRLQKIAQDCAFKYQKRFVNRKMEALIEGRCKNRPDYWQGYADNYIKILTKSRRDLKNKIISLKLKKIIGNALLAEESL